MATTSTPAWTHLVTAVVSGLGVAVLQSCSVQKAQAVQEKAVTAREHAQADLNGSLKKLQAMQEAGEERVMGALSSAQQRVRTAAGEHLTVVPADCPQEIPQDEADAYRAGLSRLRRVSPAAYPSDSEAPADLVPSPAGDPTELSQAADPQG